MTKIAYLPHRGVVELRGADRVAFLNGLVSNDVAKASPGQALWAAMLTPQGKYLVDFFIFTDGERLLLDVLKDEIPALIQKLRRFKLRSAVEIEDVSETLQTYVAWHGTLRDSPLTAPDPRLPDSGYRCLSPQPLECSATAQDYNTHRLSLGLADGPPDLEPGKTLLLEAGFDELHGIDWNKGCYMGQELTARTKYRGLIKRRLLPVTLAQAGLITGTTILAHGQEVGTLRSIAGTSALATLQLSALLQPLYANDTLITVNVPRWMPALQTDKA